MPNREELLQLQTNFRSMLRRMRMQWDQHLDSTLNPTQFAVLERLYRHGALKVTEVANELCLTPGAVTGITYKLMEMNYVIRKGDTMDRRINYLELTEEGRKRVIEVSAQREQLFVRFFEGVPDEELRHFMNVCKQVNQNLDEFKQNGQ
ncbi:MarR family transcriptional regulator [Paenibacillus profundus]|uniref:MarR family transcriptional regulator n=1 Tax=Paenibacillus profundus TaxID=1173085 RepID=A0ABS8YL63_9BACL|nr:MULTISPECIES: MarR family transcriptional regulator [Paenibacillus]MCE5171944.1 MarR family transcriptional regulator [Paenibacillus profundus]MCM3341413.1 MarR family transcriptional regulator [Paenibacillus sp. MER TA 81-3]